jgi:hypothetical protein
MKRLFIAVLLIAALALPAMADHLVTPAGYAQTEAPVTGGWMNGFDFASGGNLYVYTDTVKEIDSAGGLVRDYYTVPTGYFGSFVRFDFGGDKLYFGENKAGINTTEGTIYSIDLNDGTYAPHIVASLAGNYDFALRSSNEAFVIVGSDIYDLDLVSGASKKVVTTPGVSGALDVDADGNLYYGTAASWATDGQSVVKWSATQVENAIATGDALTVADGIKLADDLASVCGLAVDSTGIYFTVSANSPAQVMRFEGLELGGTLSEFAHASSDYEWFSTVRANQATGGVYVNAGTAISVLTPVPEPTSLTALALGLGAVFARRKRA